MSQEDLDAFVSLLNDKRMPVFASTVGALSRLTGRDDTSVSELVQAILKDTSMTAQVLKIANSPYYRLGMQKTNTVSRAVMLVGFQAVRSIFLSIKVIEYFLKRPQRDQLVREMAKSFHAAVQAKALAVALLDESPEEIFVTTLLFNLGEIAFWCHCPDELAEKLQFALNKPGYTRSSAELEVLGFRLKELTVQLCRDWSLGELLDSALEGDVAASPRIRYVLLGTRIAASVGEGWNSPRFKSFIKEMGTFLKLPVERVVEFLRSNAKRAAQTAVTVGAEQICQFIKLPADENGEAVPSETEALDEIPDGSPFQELDQPLQLQILREISGMLMEGQLNPKLLLSMMLEGILRGVGMDRVVFANLTPDSEYLKVNSALGLIPKKATQDFALIPVKQEFNVFSHVLQNQQVIWVKPNLPQELSCLLTKEVQKIAGAPPFFLAAVMANNRAVGVICADRKVSKRNLDEESFLSFKHFSQLASIGLSLLCVPGSVPRQNPDSSKGEDPKTRAASWPVQSRHSN